MLWARAGTGVVATHSLVNRQVGILDHRVPYPGRGHAQGATVSVEEQIEGARQDEVRQRNVSEGGQIYPNSPPQSPDRNSSTGHTSMPSTVRRNGS